ncbi:6,7-dimethyl-8-ribityllumazine synthase [Azospirillum thermophilum]|uniref:6,7-dimethyl-8-ribityllumazine synthase n=1 Tax=Azospirillum thermophilum TaxID=2202148 RepID=A0A2S2CVA3_9PROT|nr:6,7-dimethyl-8-ribityllumazine synthase [Azospirillum thermophilum]AWK88442.1 6,7-dimethyl-8-ribityllumazine synthase [Azospirillum thermophilum]
MNTIGIVLGRFHRREVEEMLDEARAVAARRQIGIVAEVWVPGSMEKPLAIKRLLQRPDVGGAVALGIIERGETEHGNVMGHAVIGSLINLQLEFMKPVGVGILGPGINPSQIPPRIRPYAAAAVEAVAEMFATA